MSPNKKRNVSKVKIKNEKKREEFLLKSLSVVIGDNNDAVDIADCGFSAELTYFCPDHSKLPGCLARMNNGGWIPTATIAKQKYLKCKKIKEDINAKHFNSHFDNSFKK